jgi:hypothetical protein
MSERLNVSHGLVGADFGGLVCVRVFWSAKKATQMFRFRDRH